MKLSRFENKPVRNLGLDPEPNPVPEPDAHLSCPLVCNSRSTRMKAYLQT